MNGIITNQQPEISITNTIPSPSNTTVDLEITQNLQQYYQMIPDGIMQFQWKDNTKKD